MQKHAQDDKLKSQLISHYSQQHLSNEQLTNLLQLQSTTAPMYKRAITGIAAGLLVTICLYFYNTSTHDFSAISKDIAYNHNSQLQMEVLSNELNTVRNHLNRLGFTLVNSNKVQSDKLKLIGGRYCNINGKIAAQMKLRHTTTKAIYTFYQAKIGDSSIREDINLDEMAIDGVKIKLWREKGLLMGLAYLK